MDAIRSASAIKYSSKYNDKLLELYLIKMAAGDKDALCKLYEQTKSAVYGFALSILKNTSDAEDILQETYIQIFSSAKLYKSYGKPMAWIFTIVRNLSLMKLRDGKKTANIPEEEWECYCTQNSEVIAEDRLILSAAMDVLSDEERQIVILHATAGFKHREMADLLELPLPTVLSKYYRAIKKLRMKLTEGEENEK